MFNVGDRVVHPMHGSGFIEGIESKIVGGIQRDYYNVSIRGGNIRLMFPAENNGTIRLRAVISSEVGASVLEHFRSVEIDMNAPWGKRYKENSERIKTGDPKEVAEVVKALMLRDKMVGLSTGDRQMMVTARNILISELAMVLEREGAAIQAELETVINETIG
ncbi:MAG: CarD family transcriptional regulator [Clostridia bacterium]|nr:CarD family transcriptional regulator [Clostridia bacterium]